MLAIQRWKMAHSDHLKINKKKEGRQKYVFTFYLGVIQRLNKTALVHFLCKSNFFKGPTGLSDKKNKRQDFGPMK